MEPDIGPHYMGPAPGLLPLEDIRRLISSSMGRHETAHTYVARTQLLLTQAARTGTTIAPATEWSVITKKDCLTTHERQVLVRKLQASNDRTLLRCQGELAALGPACFRRHQEEKRR